MVLITVSCLATTKNCNIYTTVFRKPWYFLWIKKNNPGPLFLKPSTRKERAHPKQPPPPCCVWVVSWSAAMDKSKRFLPLLPPIFLEVASAQSVFPPLLDPRSYIAKVCGRISFPFFAVHDRPAWPG